MFLLPLFCILAAVSGAPSTELPAGVSNAAVDDTLNLAAPLPNTSPEKPAREDSLVATSPVAEEQTQFQSVPSIPSEHTSKQPCAPSEEKSINSKNPKKQILGYNVEAYDYQIPKGMYKEIVDSNDWIWFLRYPEYTMDFHYYCLFHLVKDDAGERVKSGETKDCLCTVELSYWIEEGRTEVLLDVYKIPFEDGAEALSETSIVISHPKDNIHSIALAMANGKCKQMKYTMDDSFMVKVSVEDVDCNKVEKMKLENDAWTEANIPKKEKKKYDDNATDEKTTTPVDTDSTAGAPVVKDTNTAIINTNDIHSADVTTRDANTADTSSKDTNNADSIVQQAKNLKAIDLYASSAKSCIDKDCKPSTESTPVLSNPHNQNTDAVSPHKQSTEIAVSQGSVIASSYTIPIGPFREHPFANHWVSLDKHPTFSLNFYLYCPYELEPYDNLVVRRANLDECRPIVRLCQYSDEYKKDILLDTFKIKEEFINQDVINSIDVQEVEGNKAVVMLTMVNNKCRRKTYEMLPGGVVKAEREEIECEKGCQTS